MKQLYKTEFLDYELSVCLQKIGFDENTFGYYNLRDNFEYFGRDLLMDTHCVQVKAPLYQQIINWLRENHNLLIEIQVDKTSDMKFCYEIYKYEDFGNWIRLTDVDKWGLTTNYNKNLTDAIRECIGILNNAI